MDISFERLISLFLNKLKFILLVSIIVSLGTYVYSNNFLDKKYTSSSTVLIAMNSETMQNSSTELTVTKNLVDNYIKTLYTENFFSLAANEVNRVLNTNYTSSQLKSATTIKASSAEKSSSDFNLSYTSGDPELSQKVLVIITDCALSYVNDKGFPNKLMRIDDPTYPSNPSFPKVKSNTLYAFLIVFVASTCFFYFREIFDNRIKNVRDISGEYDLFILGVIPDFVSPKPKRTKGYHTYSNSYSKEESKNGKFEE